MSRNLRGNTEIYASTHSEYFDLIAKDHWQWVVTLKDNVRTEQNDRYIFSPTNQVSSKLIELPVSRNAAEDLFRHYEIDVTIANPIAPKRYRGTLAGYYRDYTREGDYAVLQTQTGLVVFRAPRSVFRRGDKLEIASLKHERKPSFVNGLWGVDQLDHHHKKAFSLGR